MKMQSKVIALGTLVGILAASAPAAPVTYWFSGYVSEISNPSNAMPFNVTIGAPFAAQLTYDPSLVGFSNLNSYPGGDIGFYYFTNTSGFSMKFQIAGHTITNTARPGRNCGLIGVYDQFNNEDSYWAETGGSLTVDGSPYLSDPYFSVIAMYLDDDSKTAFSTVAIPTNAPVLSQFTSHRDLTWGAYIDDGNPTQLFAITGILTSITTNEQVLLNYRSPSVNTLQLGWPITVSGFTLQSSSDLTIDNWQTVTNPVVDISVEHTVTVSTTGPARFFRLFK
jgi:hypothetical protein